MEVQETCSSAANCKVAQYKLINQQLEDIMEPQKKNTVAVDARQTRAADMTAAVQALTEATEHLNDLLLTISGSPREVAEKCSDKPAGSALPCIQALLIETPDRIRNEAARINEVVNEIGSILH